jgi:hypothetical protein
MVGLISFDDRNDTVKGEKVFVPARAISDDGTRRLIFEFRIKTYCLK